MSQPFIQTETLEEVADLSINVLMAPAIKEVFVGALEGLGEMYEAKLEELRTQHQSELKRLHSRLNRQEELIGHLSELYSATSDQLAETLLELEDAKRHQIIVALNFN